MIDTTYVMITLMSICLIIMIMMIIMIMKMNRTGSPRARSNDNTPGLHNRIPAYNIFARGWVAQTSICFTGSG